MSKYKQTDAEAMAELREWCRPLGLEVRCDSLYVTIFWMNPEDGEKCVVASEQRPSLGNGRRVSVAATCRKLVKNRLMRNGQWPRYLTWSRKTKRFRRGCLEVEASETATIALPDAKSPAELEIRLAADGWTGNPFGSSKGLLEEPVIQAGLARPVARTKI